MITRLTAHRRSTDRRDSTAAWLRFAWWAGGLVWAATVAVGCLPDESVPQGNETPLTCGDGRCDVLTEDCARCPGDCPCCAIIDSKSNDPNAQQPDLAIGAPDGRVVELGEQSDIFMAFGRDVFDCRDEVEGNKPDFRIYGSVTSTSDVAHAGTCFGAAASSRGAFEVMVSADALDWRLVGLWAKQSDGTTVSTFDIGCAELPSARWVRLRGELGATAQLDAITAIEDADGNPISCIEANDQRPQSCLLK